MALTKTEMRRVAQDQLLSGVSVALGYWTEQQPQLAESMTDAERAEYRAVLKAQADRIARMFGYAEAWTS
jgi:hypothetical protein